MIVDRCRCGHNAARHEAPGLDGECIADGCRCTRYEPAMPTPAPTRAFPTAPILRPTSVSLNTAPAPRPRIETVEQLVAAARETGDKRALLVIGRIQSMAAELSALVAAHRANQAAQAARERDEAYKAQLAAMPKPARPGRGQKGIAKPRDKRCDICGRDDLANVGVHKRNVHQDLGLTCPDCPDRRFRTKAALTHHRAAAHESTQVTCPDCGANFVRHALGPHRYQAHGIRAAAS